MTADLVASAASITSDIRAARAETDEARRLPDAVVSKLVEAGMFRQALPSELGGDELAPPTALSLYEELARAEASVAWLVWNSALPCLFSRFLDSETRAEIFGDPSSKYASSTRPSGRATLENGHYRLRGRWSLVSGCLHADWLGFMHMVEEDGEIQMLEPGAPNMRLAFVPSDACEILDTWHVGGLRGTGSHDVVLEDVVVPVARSFSPMDESRVDRPIGRIPIAATMAAGHAAICLGVAQAALDAVIELAHSKVTVDPVPDLRDRSVNQITVARAGVKLPALRGELRAALDRLWELAREDHAPTADDIAHVWGTAVTTARECRDLVTELCDVGGSSSLYTDCVLERCHRDIQGALQHIVVQRMWLEEAGRVKLGMEPTHPLFWL